MISYPIILSWLLYVVPIIAILKASCAYKCKPCLICIFILHEKWSLSSTHNCTMFYPLFLFFFLFSHGNLSFGDNSSSLFRSFRMLHLPTPTIGPEALAFDCSGAGPYASVADGRVLKWQAESAGFVDFTVASPSR